MVFSTAIKVEDAADGAVTVAEEMSVATAEGVVDDFPEAIAATPAAAPTAAIVTAPIAGPTEENAWVGSFDEAGPTVGSIVLEETTGKGVPEDGATASSGASNTQIFFFAFAKLSVSISSASFIKFISSAASALSVPWSACLVPTTSSFSFFASSSLRSESVSSSSSCALLFLMSAALKSPAGLWFPVGVLGSS